MLQSNMKIHLDSRLKWLRPWKLQESRHFVSLHDYTKYI